MSKTWFNIVAADSETAEIHIFDYIGEWGVTARGFVNELKAITASNIDLHINSPGGSVIDGVAIQNALKQHPANVTTYIDGLAGSIASIIALAGDQISIADNAYVMIHNPSSVVLGEASDMRKEADVLDKMANGAASDYAKRMNITIEEARALMDAETWYLGQEAVDAGYADWLHTGSQMVASFDAERFTAKTPEDVLKRFTQSPPGGNYQPSAKLKPKELSMSDETTATETETASVEPVIETVEPVEVVTDSTEPTAEVVDKAVQQALASERVRTAELTAVGNKFGFGEDAETFIAQGKSVEEFRAHILNKSPDDWKASLAVQNPATQETASDDDESNEAIAKVKERRAAKYK
jgi:ATP-dependent protease ClpP protease subunit